jgi:UDP-N-acetylmuramate dehydrogenase
MSPSAFGPRTTLRVGGTADELVELAGPSDLAGLVGRLAGRPVFVLGNGSNTLVADAGFPGVVVHLGPGFSEVAFEGVRVRAGAAADLPVIARRSVEAGLAGFEWAVGVPGTLGGAVAMNAGGHGSDMAACVVEATIVDLRTGSVSVRSKDALAFGYRTSSVAPHELVLEATLELHPGDPEEGRRRLREIVRWRREHQPGGANCGSVFTNPQGDSAGRLIEAAGLAGRRHGSAEVSTKHANFIQAAEGGSADDVVALMLEVAEVVEAASGVRLRSEVRLVGVDEEVRDRLGGRG